MIEPEITEKDLTQNARRACMALYEAIHHVSSRIAAKPDDRDLVHDYAQAASLLTHAVVALDSDGGNLLDEDT